MDKTLSRPKKTDKVSSSFLATADWHVDKKLFNFPELRQDLRDCAEDAVNRAIQLNVENFIIVGDVVETNRPDENTINFLISLRNKLEKAGINPLALAGDHDVPSDNISWINDVAGFRPISEHPKFIGINYDLRGNVVIEKLDQQVKQKPEVEFIFLHGQVPELWPFCEEKKLLPLNGWFKNHSVPNLKGFVLGDIHKPFESTFVKDKQEIYVGYCGSLGVTSSDETDKTGYIYYDGAKLKRESYILPRSFIKYEVTKDTIQNYVANKDKLLSQLKSFSKKPILLLHYASDILDQLDQLNYVYEQALVKRIKIKTEENVPYINLRSELKTNDRIVTALRQVDSLSDPCSFELALNLLGYLNNAKTILDKFKEVCFI